MGVLIGVIVGYVMGAKAGEQGLEELKEAWATIRASDEVRELIAGGLSMAAGLITRGGELLGERLHTTGTGSGAVTPLRPTG
jgi:hypothetical protein